MELAEALALPVQSCTLPMSGFDLPEDIVVKILCRLPVRSLIRFTCVSKRWRSIVISDPQFCKSHLQLSQLRQRLLITTYPISFDTCLPPRFLSFERDLTPLVKHDHYLRIPLEVRENQQGLTSCNGLVLLGLGDNVLRDIDVKKWSVWNPSTGFFREIPSPRMARHNSGKGYRDFVICGFGYVSAIEDYKFVAVTIPRNERRFHVGKLLKLLSTFHQPTTIITRMRWGLFQNEAIHWVNYRGGDSDPAIHAFDLAEEKFREMPLPVSIQNVDRSMRDTRTQLLLGGCLCVWTTWLITKFGQ